MFAQESTGLSLQAPGAEPRACHSPHRAPHRPHPQAAVAPVSRERRTDAAGSLSAAREPVGLRTAG